MSDLVLNKIFYVYVFTSPSNKSYIGITNNIKLRMYGHKNSALKNEKRPFAYAIRKYGLDNFKFEVIEYVDTWEQAQELEKYYIKMMNTKFPNGYNLTGGGEGTYGHECSEETRQKMSKSGKGKHIWTDDMKQALSKKKIGIKQTPETIEKVRLSLIGRKHSQEAKQKMSKSAKGNTHWLGKHHSEETKKLKSLIMTGKKRPDLTTPEARSRIQKTIWKNSHPVMCKETNLIYKSKNEAARQLNISSMSVYYSIKYNKPVKNYTFISVEKGA